MLLLLRQRRTPQRSARIGPSSAASPIATQRSARASPLLLGLRRAVAAVLPRTTQRERGAGESPQVILGTGVSLTATIACRSGAAANPVYQFTMGTTLTALQAGSTAIKYSVMIEGYDRVLTDATAAQIATAYAGVYDQADRSTALIGLYVDLHNRQELNPWKPFLGGGQCVLRIAPDSADTFGIETHRKTQGNETTLTVTLDRDDTTITVADTTGFAASGYVHIGTECIKYSGKTATTFTGCTRGMFAPQLTNAGNRFAEDHRVGNGSLGEKLKPVVTSQTRVWLGRRVSVYVHRQQPDGTLDTVANAQLVYAGRIASYKDDPNDFCTVVELSHALDEVSEYVLGRDMYSAKVREGVWLRAGLEFQLADVDNINGGTVRTSNKLTVVPGAPASVNEIQAGRFSLSLLCQKINAWLTAELAAGRIYGTYTLSSPIDCPQGKRTFVTWRIPNAGSTTVKWVMTMPVLAARFLGFDQGDPAAASGNFSIDAAGPDDTLIDKASDFTPLRYVVFRQMEGVNADLRFEVEDERGTFADQLASLPPPPPAVAGSWGIFLLDNKYAIVGQRDTSGTVTVIKNVCPTIALAGVSKAPGTGSTEGYCIPADDPTVLEITQVFVFVGNFDDLMKRFFFSTGTTGFNHATWDTLPIGIGLGLPASIMPNLVSSIDALPNATAPLVVVLAKPTKFAELVSGDLVPRFAFPRWRAQGLELRTWILPTSADSVATLSESTKAAPAGNVDNHRAPTITDDAWQRSIVKVQYNRLINSLDDRGYQSSITFEDSTAVDDAGGAGKAITIDARNTYAEYAGTGQAIEQLMPGFLAMLPLFSRPFRKLTRAIDLRYYEGLSVGDVVLLTDAFARDPDTGRRSVAARPAFVIGHRYSFGGLTSPKVAEGQDMVGEVDLMMLDVDRLAVYGPAAQVDDTAANAGYDVATKVLTCYPHKHSESSEQVDATRFIATDKVRVIEVDPDDPTAALTWQDTISSQSGNTITLTTGLAGWDNTKRYRVMYDAYTTCTASQQVKCFEASSTTLSIQATRAPFQYNARWPDTTYTANAASDAVELPATTNLIADGKSLDAGHDMAIVTLVNALCDRKTAISSPWLSDTVASGTGATGTYRLVMYRPIWLTEEQLTGACYRSLTVAPWFRSSDGTAATVRVTLTDTAPFSTSIDDVNLGQNYVSATFSSSSTTWGTGTPATLDMRVKTPAGLCYLVIECTAKAETRGLAQCQVGART